MGRIFGLGMICLALLLINLALKTTDVWMGMAGLFILLLGIGKLKNG